MDITPHDILLELDNDDEDDEDFEEDSIQKDDHFIAYIGLLPGSHSSGERVYRGRISKRGNKRVRTALILSAWMAIANSTEMARAYEHYRSKGKTANIAIVKMARKLALRMKAVLRDKKKYEIRNN